MYLTIVFGKKTGEVAQSALDCIMSRIKLTLSLVGIGQTRNSATATGNFLSCTRAPFDYRVKILLLLEDPIDLLETFVNEFFVFFFGLGCYCCLIGSFFLVQDFPCVCIFFERVRLSPLTFNIGLNACLLRVQVGIFIESERLKYRQPPAKCFFYADCSRL